MKNKTIALLCAFTIAAVLAVASTGFANDSSPPGSEQVEPNILNELNVETYAPSPILAPFAAGEFAINVAGDAPFFPAESVKARPPNQARFARSTYGNESRLSITRRSLRPDH